MDKIVVITGGTSGIGLDLKSLFEANGDKVFTISSRELPDENHYSCDLVNELKVKQVINEIGQNNGRIDILINSAGCGMSGITELVSMEDIQKVTNVNYYGTLYTIRAAIRFMQEGSRIVNLSSAMALFPVPFRAIYGAVKSAILSLSYSLRMELKTLGIDVVALCPGDIKTNFTKNRIKDFETNERYGDRLVTATAKSDAREEKRIPSMACAKVIFKKITKKRTKPMYIIGGKYKFLYFLSRITPKTWLLGITNKLYGGKVVENPKEKALREKQSQVKEELPKDISREENMVALEETNVIESDVSENIEESIQEESQEQSAEPSETDKAANLFGMIDKLKSNNKEEE